MAQRETSKRAKEIAAAVLAIGVPLLALHANLKSPNAHHNFLDRALLRLTSPLAAASTWCIRGVGGTWHHYVALVGVVRENEALRLENARLRAQIITQQQAASRADEYERLLGLKQTVASDTVAARAVAAQTSGFYRMLRLRLDLSTATLGGRTLEPGLPVVAADGLVGTLRDVYGDYADVQLVTDPGSGIDVVVARSGARAIFKGLGDGRTGYLDSLRFSDDVRPGDLVITSGVRPFPSDLAVGRVTRVVKPPAGMTQEADVELTTDLAKINNVLVLLPPSTEAAR